MQWINQSVSKLISLADEAWMNGKIQTNCSSWRYPCLMSLIIFIARASVPRTRWWRARLVTRGTTGVSRADTSSWATAPWQVRTVTNNNSDNWYGCKLSNLTHKYLSNIHYLFSSQHCHFPDDNNQMQSFQFRLVTTWTMLLWRNRTFIISKNVKEIYFQNF